MAGRRLSAEQRAKIFKALADPKRVDIVDALVKGPPMCGTALSDALGVSLALLCHHWEVLVDAGVLKKERVGQLRVCTVDVERIREAVSGWGLVGPPPQKAAGAGLCLPDPPPKAAPQKGKAPRPRAAKRTARAKAAGARPPEGRKPATARVEPATLPRP